VPYSLRATRALFALRHQSQYPDQWKAAKVP
jgi:hypothetical protein